MQKKKSTLTLPEKHYADVLVLFLMKLEEIRGKKYYKDFVYIRGTDQRGQYVEGSECEEDSLIAYLAAVRQLLLEKEPIALRNVRAILSELAGRASLSDVKVKLASLDDRWKKWKIGVDFRFSNGVERFENWDLVNFWVHNKFFHTDLRMLHITHGVPAEPLKVSRKMMEVYVCEFVRHAMAHTPLIMRVMSQVQLPKGQFGLPDFSDLPEIDLDMPAIVNFAPAR